MCRLSMDGYIDKLLIKYNHTIPTKPQLSPHRHREIVYGAKEQLTLEEDTSPALNASSIKRVQAIVGALLYYARAVDNKLLAAVSTNLLVAMWGKLGLCGNSVVVFDKEFFDVAVH